MKTTRHGMPLPTSETLRARLAQAGVRTDVEPAQEDGDKAQARYRHKLAKLRLQLMEVSADPCATFSDKLVLSGLQKHAEKLGNDFPLTSHGRRKFQRIRSRESCVERCERGCPND